MSPLSIVITIVVIVLIFMLLSNIFSDPYTLQNIQNGETSSTIKASSLATNGSNVASSNFAYSVWMYVNDWNYRYGEPKVVFGRMGGSSGSGAGSIPGVSGLDPCPAVVLGDVENNINISLGCYPGLDQLPTTAGGTTVVHTCSVANIPIQKWVHLLLSVNGRTLDTYIDGKLVRTCVMPGVAVVNAVAPIFVTPGGGFSGWTSQFQYWGDATDPQTVWNIYKKGYGGSFLGGLFGTYAVKLSLLNNNVESSSYTI